MWGRTHGRDETLNLAPVVFFRFVSSLPLVHSCSLGRLGNRREGPRWIRQRRRDGVGRVVEAPVKEHGEHVRVRRGVVDLRVSQRPPLPVAALLSLVHVRSQHGRHDGGQADAYELLLPGKSAQRDSLDVDDGVAQDGVPSLAELGHYRLSLSSVIFTFRNFQRMEPSGVSPSKPLEVVPKPETEPHDLLRGEQVT